MHWELSDEQDLYATSLREWLQEKAKPDAVRSWLDTGDTASFAQLLVDEGWSSVGFEESVGGQGGGLLELALTARELGRTAAPSSGWMQTAAVAPALARETELLSAAISSDAAVAVASRSDRIPGYAPVQRSADRLTGKVPVVLGAAQVAHLLVPVKDDNGAALWLVDRNADGLTIHPRHLLDRSRAAADIIFDDAPARRLDVDAQPCIDEIALRAAVLTAADALGAAERMLALTVDYSKQRQQFGTPIGAFQAVKHAAAQMLVTVESSVSIVYYAAQSIEEALPDRALHAAIAKAQVTKAVAALADTSLTLHGAIGYTWEHDLQLFYKRAKLDETLFGGPSAWNERIAKALPLLPVAT